MFTEQGREAALKAIDDPKGPFVKGELYVFALTMDNVLVGHPHDKKLKQLNMTNIKDGNGEFCFKKFHEIASKDGSGWVNYTWTKPGEKDASPKKSYILKVPDADMYIGAGYYIK
jgi:cytochrome c